MALFTNKADQKLPVLTQLYQAEGSGEILEIYLRFAKYAHCLSDEVAEEIETTGRPIVIDDMIPTLTKNSISILREYMNSYVEGIKISNDLSEKIINILNTRPKYEKTYSEGIPDENGYILANRLVAYTPNEDQLYPLIVEELLSVLENPNRYGFLKCEECHNPFVSQKDEQKYCSQRCRARVGSRRRYAKLFDGLPNKKGNVDKTKKR